MEMPDPKGFRNDIISLRHDTEETVSVERFMERTDRMKMFQKNQFGKALRQLSDVGVIQKSMTSPRPNIQEMETSNDMITFALLKNQIYFEKDSEIKPTENEMLEYSISLNDLSDLEKETLELMSASKVNQHSRHLHSSMPHLDSKGLKSDDDLRVKAVANRVRRKSKDRVGSMSADSSPMRSRRTLRASGGIHSADCTPPRDRRPPKRSTSRDIDMSPASNTSLKSIDNNVESTLYQIMVDSKLGVLPKQGRTSRSRSRRNSREKKVSKELNTRKSRRKLDIEFSSYANGAVDNNKSEKGLKGQEDLSLKAVPKLNTQELSADTRILQNPVQVGKNPRSKSVDKTQSQICVQNVDDCGSLQKSKTFKVDRSKLSTERMHASITIAELIEENAKEHGLLSKPQSQSLSSIDDTINLTDSSASVDLQHTSFLSLERSSSNKIAQKSLKDGRHSRSRRRSSSENPVHTEDQHIVKDQLQKLLLLRQLNDGCSLSNSAKGPPSKMTSSERNNYGESYTHNESQHTEHSKARVCPWPSSHKNPLFPNQRTSEEQHLGEAHASPLQASPGSNKNAESSRSLSASGDSSNGHEIDPIHVITGGKTDRILSLKSENFLPKNEVRASRSSRRSSSADSVSTRDQRASKRRPSKKILSRHLSDDSLSSQERTNSIPTLEKRCLGNMKSQTQENTTKPQHSYLEGENSAFHDQRVNGDVAASMYSKSIASNLSPRERNEYHDTFANTAFKEITHSKAKTLKSAIVSAVTMSHSQSASEDSPSTTVLYSSKRQRQKMFVSQEEIDVISKGEISNASKFTSQDNNDDRNSTRETFIAQKEGSISFENDGFHNSEKSGCKIISPQEVNDIFSRKTDHDGDVRQQNSKSSGKQDPSFVRDQSVPDQKQREISPSAAIPNDELDMCFPDACNKGSHANALEKSAFRRSKSSHKSTSSDREIARRKEKESGKNLEGDSIHYIVNHDEDDLDSSFNDLLSDSSARTIQRSNVTTIQKSMKKDRTKAFCNTVNSYRGGGRNSPKPRKKKLEGNTDLKELRGSL
jgi:hypothetical protein